MKVYLDNAATTPIAPEVVEAMLPILKEGFGNPSSIHSFGRAARAHIEKSRRAIATRLNVAPGEIFFTSGGTEADNMAIRGAIKTLGLKHAISTCIEHHAVGHTLEELEKKGLCKVSYVNIKPDGHIDLDHLKELLANNERSFVSLMHANNEIGNLIDLKEVGDICEEYDAIFHSDTVQTMAHYQYDLKAINIHFVAASAHKFHGPKGNGFLYVNTDSKIAPFITGGSQERNMRGGTENVYGIVGLAKAFELAFDEAKEHEEYVLGLKNHMIEQLEANIPGVSFNGDAKGNSLYTILNVRFPHNPKGDMILYNLDILGIACSGGSACTSGSNQGSHVLKGMCVAMDQPSIRFSFSRFNTIEEIDYTLSKLKVLFPAEVMS